MNNNQGNKLKFNPIGSIFCQKQQRMAHRLGGEQYDQVQPMWQYIVTGQ